MNLEEEILREHSKDQTNRLVAYIGHDQTKFDALMDLFATGNAVLTQRVSSVISYCVEAHPQLIEKHLATFVQQLDQPIISNTVKRNVVRVLQYSKVPESISGYVVDVCFKLITAPEEPVAIKAFSLTVLANLAQKYPDLKSEILLVIEDQWPRTTAAFHSRAKKIQRTFLAGQRVWSTM